MKSRVFKKIVAISTALLFLLIGAAAMYLTGLGESTQCESECQLFGRCTFEDGMCVVRGNDCSLSLECSTYGLCQSDKGFCVANSNSNCASSSSCLLQGRCSQKGGVCIASSAGCLSTPRCQKFGLCTAVNNACAVTSDLDCNKSLVCKNEGKCFEVAGHCELAKK